MLAVEHELQPPADYITTAGAIGPEHRHFLISWMTMVRILTGTSACCVVKSCPLHLNKTSVVIRSSPSPQATLSDKYITRIGLSQLCRPMILPQRVMLSKQAHHL